MANFAWLDEFLDSNDPLRQRILLRAVTEALVSEVQARIGLDRGRDIEHRCYELLNAALDAQLNAPAPPRPAGAPSQATALTCARCGRQLTDAESNIIETGVLCDTCFAARSG